MKRRNTIILGVVVFLVIIGIVTSMVFFFMVQSSHDFLIEVYDADRAASGTTLFADLHDKANPRIVEVNMQGDIVWEYRLPDDLKGFTEPGMDVELLPNGNILFLCPLKGVFEVQRSGVIVWSYLNGKVSHDADRLPNGNTLLVAMVNQRSKIFEVTQDGDIVWELAWGTGISPVPGWFYKAQRILPP